MYGNSPYGSPVLGRGMFQPQVSPQYQQMLEMRDFLRSQRAMPQPAPFQPMPQPLEPMPTAFDRLAPALDISTLQPMEASAVMGDPSMGTPFDPETFDGEARPITLEPLDGRQMIGATAPQETSAQLEQVQQAVNQMQQNQQALANHLGAGSQMASNHNQRLLDLNQRQIGLAGLLQPQRPMTQGPESMMLRQIGGRPQ